MKRTLVVAAVWAVMAGSVWGQQKLPDLQVTKFKAPFCAMPHDEATIEMAVANFGDAGTGFFEVTIFISDDLELDQSDEGIYTFTHSGLLARQIKSTKKSFRIPPGVKLGAFYIGAILDPKDAVEETNEANNHSRPTPIQFVKPETPAAAVLQRFREELAARDAVIAKLQAQLAPAKSGSGSMPSEAEIEILTASLRRKFGELFSGQGPMGQRYAIDDVKIHKGKRDTSAVVKCKVLMHGRVEDSGKMLFHLKDDKWEYGGPAK